MSVGSFISEGVTAATPFAKRALPKARPYLKPAALIGGGAVVAGAGLGIGHKLVGEGRVKVASESIYENKIRNLINEFHDMKAKEDADFQDHRTKYAPQYKQNTLSALGGLVGGAGVGALAGKFIGTGHPIMGALIGAGITPLVALAISDSINKRNNPDFGKERTALHNMYGEGAGNHIYELEHPYYNEY